MSIAAIRADAKTAAPDGDKAERVEFALDQLVRRALISPRDRQTLSSLINQTDEPLDLAICKLALASESDVALAFCDIFGLRRFDNQDSLTGEPSTHGITPSFIRRHRVAPLTRQARGFLVAVANPSDPTGVAGCAFALNAPVTPVVATDSEINSILDAIAPELESPADLGCIEVLQGDAERLRDLASAEPVVRHCNRLVSDAARARASDIHIEPKERDFRVRFRIDGALFDREPLSHAHGLAVISRFKILSNLDIAERRRPQDGRFSFPVAGRSIDLRISVAPNIHGEGVVLRLLGRDDITPDLERLGFSEEHAAQLRRLSDLPNGILLLTGPTGSGKTTTLYALLRRLASRDIKILTIEDPVEYQIKGVSQTQIQPAVDLTFAGALRSFLRHDPDVIMVGEMRDLETARTAVQAALTGHLVLSTLHTNDAPSAVARLIDMGVDDYLVASTLLGVVAQRLVRCICRRCGGKVGPRSLEDSVCPDCAGTGFHGRIAVSEVLEINDELRSQIRAGISAGEIRRAARAGGFLTMRQDGETKVCRGVITEFELARAIIT